MIDRMVLSDAPSDRMAPLIIGRADKRDRLEATTGCSWRAFYGLCVRELAGVIFQRRLAIGTAFSNASAAGARRLYGGDLRSDV